MIHPKRFAAVLDEPAPPRETSNPYKDVIMSERDGPAYLRSAKWKKKREQALERADHRCQVCNSPHELQVHHRTYEHWGNERLTDLTVLCRSCHCIFHGGGRILGLYYEEGDVVV